MLGSMAELTNLTDRISHLRDRKGSSPVVQGGGLPPRQTASGGKALMERRFPIDYFMFFVYALLGVALVSQLFLIIWLEVI